jgi:hypothetical protein
MTKEAIELLRKFCDKCARELNHANFMRETEYAKDIVFIEHKLQLMKKAVGEKSGVVKGEKK